MLCPHALAAVLAIGGLLASNFDFAFQGFIGIFIPFRVANFNNEDGTVVVKLLWFLIPLALGIAAVALSNNWDLSGNHAWSTDGCDQWSRCRMYAEAWRDLKHPLVMYLTGMSCFILTNLLETCCVGPAHVKVTREQWAVLMAES
eukprot:g16604.t1